MARLISRQEAARMLDVSTQTVTNWISKGMIKGHMVENHVMVDKETIEQFFDSLQDLAHLEKTVAEKTEYLRNADFKLGFEIHDILEAREEMENGPHGFFRWVTQHATSSAYGMFTEQQQTVFREMMGLGHVKGVAEKLGLSRSKVVKIFIKCLEKIEKTINLEQTQEKWDQLEQENERLKLLNASLKQQLAEAHLQSSCKNESPKEEDNGKMKLLSSPFVDFKFTARAINILTSLGCITMGDVACLKKEKMMTVKNCGRKTIEDIEKLLAGYGLSLDSDPQELLYSNAK